MGLDADGDRGIVDQGYIRFVGRDDDVITSAGYRIGPAEIEDCLLTHPAVATVGVVGKPDPMRTEIVKAYVVLKPEFTASDELRDALKCMCQSVWPNTPIPVKLVFWMNCP